MKYVAVATKRGYMTHPPLYLDRKQLTLFIILGVAVWFMAAIVLRVLGPLGIYDGGQRVLVYLLIIPGTMPVVWIARKLGKTSPGQLFTGFSVGTGSATLCDGVALAWFPSLYGPTAELHAEAGGTILWGAGVGLFLAYVVDRRSRVRVARPPVPASRRFSEQ